MLPTTMRTAVPFDVYEECTTYHTAVFFNERYSRIQTTYDHQSIKNKRDCHKVTYIYDTEILIQQYVDQTTL